MKKDGKEPPAPIEPEEGEIALEELKAIFGGQDGAGDGGGGGGGGGGKQQGT